MNHFLGLLFLALCVSLVFAAISKTERSEQIRYFLKMMGYLSIGSLVAAWLMSLIPR